MCQKKHPSVLHIEINDRSTSFKEIQASVSSPLSVSPGQPQTCGHKGASDENNAVISIGAVKVIAHMSNTILHTYAFLDPGSYGTFCTVSLAEKLGLKGKPANIVLDITFMGIIKSSTEMKNGHYCIDLPFREEDPVLPNNRSVAELRLQGLKRNFEKNQQFKQEYTAFLNDMLDQGYAEVVSTDHLEEDDGKVWFIPHHGVHHPTKGKIRIMFDCGAT